MHLFTSKITLQQYLGDLLNETTIGFVPTMGSLHSGHLKLILSSKQACDITICSIFVNPTQFNNPQDLKSYPKDLDSDLGKLKEINCDVVYAPPVEDLYRPEEKAKKFNFGSLTKKMEGRFRPGHFNGMATVIEKFFTIINPTTAFFGEKDLQQLQIVKALVTQMNSTIIITGVPTIREKNGLAKSSRNNLLSNNGKVTASIIYKHLLYCKKNQKQGIKKLKSYIVNEFKKQEELTLEYLEFVELDTLLPIDKWKAKNKNAICIAAYHSGIRLIDNIIL